MIREGKEKVCMYVEIRTLVVGVCKVSPDTPFETGVSLSHHFRQMELIPFISVYTIIINTSKCVYNSVAKLFYGKGILFFLLALSLLKHSL